MRICSVRGRDYHALVGYCAAAPTTTATASAASTTATTTSAGCYTDQATNHEETCCHAPTEPASACLNREPKDGETHKQQHHSAGASPGGGRVLMADWN
jgi:hypothetical protein